MDGSAKLKVPGGKLISIKLTYSERIDGIKILGDFFIHPEESLQDIEAALVGIPVASTKEEISARVGKAVSSGKIEMIGITPESIAEAVKMAIK